MRLFITCSLILLLTHVGTAQQNVPAFPGAEGFGRLATGGRGGKVFIVTNLKDDGAGSFREAVRQKGPRMILFAVSGTIALQSPIKITENDITIAGQTAPGDGICIRNFAVEIKADNVIVRYMRFRLGNEKATESDAFGGTKHDNIMIDHCSISWATDECASFYWNSNFTMQWCIISESLNQSVHQKGDHGYGGIWGGLNASFHHNLIANHNSRMPRFSGSSTVPNDPEREFVDFRNNVVYNWMNNNTYGGERGKYNLINNYYKPGPATKQARASQLLNPFRPFGLFYMDGNVVEGAPEVSKNNWLGVRVDDGTTDSLHVNSMFAVQSMPKQTAEEAFQLVLEDAGASFTRDIIDERIVNEVRTGTSTLGKLKNGIIDSQDDVGGWPDLKSQRAPKDSDGDGMPDAWERSKGLNTKDPSDGALKTMDTGYTNLEMYTNGLLK